MTAASLVFVVDDDPSVRSSLKFLLSTVGLQAETFESADSFLAESLLIFLVVLCWMSGFRD